MKLIKVIFLLIFFVFNNSLAYDSNDFDQWKSKNQWKSYNTKYITIQKSTYFCFAKIFFNLIADLMLISPDSPSGFSLCMFRRQELELHIQMIFHCEIGSKFCQSWNQCLLYFCKNDFVLIQMSFALGLCTFSGF